MPEHVTTNVRIFFVCAPFISLAKAHGVISCFVHGSNIMKELALPLPRSCTQNDRVYSQNTKAASYTHPAVLPGLWNTKPETRWKSYKAFWVPTCYLTAQRRGTPHTYGSLTPVLISVRMPFGRSSGHLQLLFIITDLPSGIRDGWSL